MIWQAATILAGLAGAATPAAAQQTMRVMGGTPAAPGQYPSMVSIQEAGPGAGGTQRHMCGGTVVGRDWVLTAAHCVTEFVTDRSPPAFPPSRIVVVEPRDGVALGAGARVIPVQRIVVHERYRPYGRPTPGGTDVLLLSHDFALLRLAQPAERPRQLLLAGAARSEGERPGRAATVVGFGHTGRFLSQGPNPRAELSARLQQGSFPLAPVDNCGRRTRGLLPAGLFGTAELCAGLVGGGQDSCQGDSGGPLMVRDGEGNLVQVGLVSSGVPCDTQRRVVGYGTYASVASQEAWIRRYVPDADFASRLDQNSLAEPRPPRPRPPNNDGSRPDSGTGTDNGNTAPQETTTVTIDIREGSRLTSGDFATFRVTSGVEGLLLVLMSDPAGEVVQFFPNNRVANFQAGQAPPSIRAGQTVVIPGPADAYRAQVQGPIGTGVLGAVVLPDTPQTRTFLSRHLDFQPIRPHEPYLAELHALMRAAGTRSAGGEPPPLAIGTRNYEVRPR